MNEPKSMWIELTGAFLLSAVAVRFARRLALKKALLDIPNERSSHKQPVPRLGGAAFMPVVLLALGLLAPRAGIPAPVFAAFLGGAIALFAVSLVDDFFTLSTTVRFAVQFAAVPLMAVVESGWAVRSLLRQDFGGQTARGGLTAALLITAMLVVWPFLADGAFTILRRLKKRENILKAHRSHLYQRLVIAGRSHFQVTLVYGALALVGAILAWRLVSDGEAACLAVGLAKAGEVIGVLFVVLWRWTVVTERKVRR